MMRAAVDHTIGSATVDDALAQDHVRAVVATSGTSFYWGMRTLPRRRREAMYAIYAYCREIDDVADGDRPGPVKLAELSAWRAEVEALFAGRPERPTTIALLDPVRRFALPRAEFDLLLDGMEMDAGGRTRAPSWATLEHYCRCVAGAVGMLSVRVFGVHGETVDRGAVALGEALQLTNILRDLKEDAALGRLYLPRELLRQHGITSDDPERVLVDPALPTVCEALAERAERCFARAASDLGAAGRRRVRPAWIMMHVYRRTLERLRARGWRDLDRTVRLGRGERLWLALRHGLR